MIAVASKYLAQAVALDQAVEAEAVVTFVETKMGPDAALPSTEISLISINNSQRNTCAPSET